VLAVCAVAARASTKWNRPIVVGHTQTRCNPADRSDLKARATTASKGFKVKCAALRRMGNYLFVYLDIAKNVAPGSYRFRVGTSESLPVWIVRWTRRAGSGVQRDDVIYLLMPDRFANGDPATIVRRSRPPGDRNAVNAYHGGDLRGFAIIWPICKTSA